MADRTLDFRNLCNDAREIRQRYKAQVFPYVFSPSPRYGLCALSCILHNIVQVGGTPAGTQLSKPLRSRTTPAEAAAFTQAASTISKDIHATAQKLGKLTRRKYRCI